MIIFSLLTSYPPAGLPKNWRPQKFEAKSLPLNLNLSRDRAFREARSGELLGLACTKGRVFVFFIFSMILATLTLFPAGDDAFNKLIMSSSLSLSWLVLFDSRGRDRDRDREGLSLDLDPRLREGGGGGGEARGEARGDTIAMLVSLVELLPDWLMLFDPRDRDRDRDREGLSLDLDPRLREGGGGGGDAIMALVLPTWLLPAWLLPAWLLPAWLLAFIALYIDVSSFILISLRFGIDRLVFDDPNVVPSLLLEFPAMGEGREMGEGRGSRGDTCIELGLLNLLESRDPRPMPKVDIALTTFPAEVVRLELLEGMLPKLLF